MRHILMALAAIGTLITSSAYATDSTHHKDYKLYKIHKIHVIREPLENLPVIYAIQNNTINIEYSGFALNGSKGVTSDITTTYTHYYNDGFTLGAAWDNTFYHNKGTANNGELQLGYTAPAAENLQLSIRAAIGDTWNGYRNGMYYAGYINADYKLNDKFTWNVLEWHGAASFGSPSWHSNELGTGLTYKINDSISLNGGVAHVWNTYPIKDYNVLKLGVTYVF